MRLRGSTTSVDAWHEVVELPHVVQGGVLGLVVVLKGSLRVRAWHAHQRPEGITETYRCDLLDGLEALAGFEVTALMLRGRSRGSRAFLSLVVGAIIDTMDRYHAGYLIADCMPSLLRLYLRMGLRQYGAPPVSSYRGILLPLIALVGDLDHLARVSSPLLQVAQRAVDAGHVPQGPTDRVIAQLEAPPDDSMETVLSDVDQLLQGPKPALSRLTEATRQHFVDKGLLIHVEAGTTVLAQGIVDRDVYVILEGALHVTRDGRSLATRGPGDLIGEMAFFRESGARTATVTALTDARLLVVRHAFLAQLKARDPLQACEVYEMLAALAVERAALR